MKKKELKNYSNLSLEEKKKILNELGPILKKAAIKDGIKISVLLFSTGALVAFGGTLLESQSVIYEIIYSIIGTFSAVGVTLVLGFKNSFALYALDYSKKLSENISVEEKELEKEKNIVKLKYLSSDLKEALDKVINSEEINEICKSLNIEKEKLEEIYMEYKKIKDDKKQDDNSDIKVSDVELEGEITVTDVDIDEEKVVHDVELDEYTFNPKTKKLKKD